MFAFAFACAFACAFCCASGFAAPPQAPANLVVNGNFEQGDKGWPADAFKRKGIEIRRQNGNAWLSIAGNGSVTQPIALDEDCAVLRVKLNMRVTDVVMGKESWHDARLAMSFHDRSGKRLEPWPNVFHAAGSSDWVRYERTFKVPAGAAMLQVAPSMFGTSGTAEFDDIEVTVAAKRSGETIDLPLPDGATDPGDLSKAWRAASPTRESICLNGLWRFLPASAKNNEVVPAPNRGWGWFKVPGIWPQSAEGSQQVRMPIEPDDADLRAMDQAWYQRPLAIPANWAGRRALLDFTMVQTHASVFVDGREAGEIFFPGGTLDVTALTKPGGTQVLSILLTARPLEAEAKAFMAPDRIVTSKAFVKNKGLTGDVYLIGQPTGPSVADVHVITSTRQGSISFDTSIENLGAGKRVLSAKIFEGTQLVKTIRGSAFDAASLKDGRVTFGGAWPDAKRWDLDAPQNQYTAVVTLTDAAGKVLDETLPVRFGFREFWIDGRDFYLNGTRLHLRPVHTSNINDDADQACLDGGRNTCRRLKEFGFNSFITGAYSFGPGEVGYMDGLFAAADDEGVLGTFTLPHVKDFGWKLDKPETADRYRQMSRWLVRRAQNHPSVVMYAMNHNSTGYKGDQNPLWMDGTYNPDEEWAKTDPKKSRNRQQAGIAAAIAKSLDPTRPVYHHQSGNLGELYTVNIYLNWAPPQERSDWLEHWATKGVKPMFFVEWGLPHISSFSSYRGPLFIWRNAAFQCLWDSEFAAAYLGPQAYRMTPTKVKSMDWEEELWAKGEPFFWSNLIRYFRSQDENYTQIQAQFAADNWRSHRTWGVSSMLPWDQENLWRLPPGSGRRQAVAKPYEGLQQPGILPDRIAPTDKQWIYSRDVSQAQPSELGNVFLRWNMPLCGYVAGDARHFTEKGHNVVAGETVRKQLIVLNDTRKPVTCTYKWALAGTALKGDGQVTVAAGDKAAVVLPLALPADVPAGAHELSAWFDFGAAGPAQTDAITLHVLPAPPAVVRLKSRVLVFDPKGETTKMLKGLGIEAKPIGTNGTVGDGDLLVIGRQALRLDGPLPGLDRLSRGGRVLVFEQDADVLEQRLGFRINVHGLRQLYARAPQHPALAGLDESHLRNWRGAATVVPPYLEIRSVNDNDPKWKWCGFDNARVWRCGNLGSLATVLIEKPDRGDFLPILDGGFDLQFTPLMEHVSGQGRALFCQLDVTARTEDDPAARTIVTNLLSYLDDAKPAPRRKAAYLGDARTAELLQQLNIDAAPAADTTTAGALLVLGPGAKLPADLRQRIDAGADVLCLGLGDAEIQAAFPGFVKCKTGLAASVPLQAASLAALPGIGDADAHWRTQPAVSLVQATADAQPASLLALRLGKGQIILCQAAPWMFDCAKKPYLRTTFRRSTFLVARLLHDLNAACAEEPAWSGQHPSLYVQQPVADDDPYRYYRW